MTARPVPVRRRIIAALVLIALADMAWGPAGCDGCTARVTRDTTQTAVGSDTRPADGQHVPSAFRAGWPVGRGAGTRRSFAAPDNPPPESVMGD